jgi:hypothetical protein
MGLSEGRFSGADALRPNVIRIFLQARSLRFEMRKKPQFFQLSG